MSLTSSFALAAIGHRNRTQSAVRIIRAQGLYRRYSVWFVLAADLSCATFHRLRQKILSLLRNWMSWLWLGPLDLHRASRRWVLFLMPWVIVLSETKLWPLPRLVR